MRNVDGVLILQSAGDFLNEVTGNSLRDFDGLKNAQQQAMKSLYTFIDKIECEYFESVCIAFVNPLNVCAIGETRFALLLDLGLLIGRLMGAGLLSFLER